MKILCSIFATLLFISLTSNAQVQLLNDEFDDAATLNANWLNLNDVEGWNAEHLEAHDINTSAPGQFTMMPWTSSWYQDWKGTLIHKNIDQNFVITTEVTATNRSGTDMPGAQYSLAGIMLRAPRNFPNGALADWTPNGENYVFLATGFAATNHPSCNGCPGPHFEVKTTEDGTSTLRVSSVPTSSNVQIRVARIDNAVLVLNRFPGGSWQVHQRYDRSLFPAELQVGLVTYTDWNKVFTYNPFFHNSHVLNDALAPDPSSDPWLEFNPDLVAHFDFVRFDDVTVPGNLAGVDLVNAASDADLLSFLGYETEHFCPMDIHVDRAIGEGQIATMAAQNNLTANNLLGSNSNTTYSAGNSVELQDGFEVSLGAELTVEAGGCN